MKKVGIVSCYFKSNYGSMLQAYATKKVLDNNGIPNETINIDNNIDFKKGKKKYYLSQIINIKFILSKFGMIKLKIDKKIRKDLGKNIFIREKKYNEFKREFNLSKSVNSYEELHEMAEEKYSDVIVGSDQLWLPVNVVADYYTLNWVPEKINKISYATSYGVANIPKKYREKYSYFLNRINHLSVREESGIKLTKDIANVDVKLVCDPTILLTKDEWEEIAIKSRIIKNKYILCYFLGKNVEHRKFAEKLKKVTGYEIVSLNHADEYVKYSDKFADIVPYDVGPKEWLNLIKNAEFVCTDSFHGSVFSLIFNKKFFVFRRYKSSSVVSTNSRIDSLLNSLDIDKKIILTGLEDVEKVLKYDVNYNLVNKKIDEFRSDSKKWLLNSITWQNVKEEKHIVIDDKELCCGCTACFSKCPKNAIEMCSDEEGFLYPIVNKDKCINCGLCKKVCPILNKNELSKFKQKGYIFQYKDDKIRHQSTSGGAFTAIAEYVIENNGVVFGVGFDKEYNVKHQEAESNEQLEKFRNSKYVQSNPNTTFRKVEKYLKEKRLVCYSGTACQIEGLLAFLGKEYENLITVDVVCRAVPSPLLWKKYFDFQSKNKNITKVFFREKYYGYKYSNLSMYNHKKVVYHNGIDTDPYLRAFFSNIASRPSCYNCHFKYQVHKADFTIFDCFEVYKFDKNLDDDKGTTRVLLNSNKAISIFDKIKEKHISKEIEVDKLVLNFHQMFNSIKYNSNRANFFEDLNNCEFDYVMNKYFPNSFKCKLEKYSRLILIKSGIYENIIKFARKLRNRD